MTNLNTYMLTRISNYAPGRTDGGAATLQALRRGSGQAIRRRDYNTLDPHATLVIVDQAITYLHTRRQALAEEATRLEQLQPVLATPHWRKCRHGQPRYLSTSSTSPRTLRLRSGQARLTAARVHRHGPRQTGRRPGSCRGS